MAFRQIENRLWTDGWFLELSPLARLLFIYSITNSHTGIIGVYELPISIVAIETGIPMKQLTGIMSELQDKVLFSNGWVFIRNHDKYSTLVGERFSTIKEKQLLLLPEDISKIYCQYKKISKGWSAPSEPLVKGSVGSNSNSNNNNNNNNKYMSIENIKEEDLQEISKDYSVPDTFVRSKIEDIKNYCASTGKEYIDYKATLRNWVKKDKPAPARSITL